MIRALLFAAGLLLAGCGGVPAAPEIVKVPVPIACEVNIPKRPTFITDTQLKSLDDFKLPLALHLDRRVRQAYERELEAVVEGCWKIRDRGGT